MAEMPFTLSTLTTNLVDLVDLVGLVNLVYTYGITVFMCRGWVTSYPPGPNCRWGGGGGVFLGWGVQ